MEVSRVFASLEQQADQSGLVQRKSVLEIIRRLVLKLKLHTGHLIQRTIHGKSSMAGKDEGEKGGDRG